MSKIIFLLIPPLPRPFSIPLFLQVVQEAAKNADLTTSLFTLQNRLTDRERTINAIKEYLTDKIGEKGILEIVSDLESKGINGTAMLQ